MWRAFFLAVGLYVLFLGAQCMLIDQATVNNPSDDGSGPATITFTPPDWCDWTLVSAGAVTILYSFTLPQKFKG